MNVNKIWKQSESLPILLRAAQQTSSMGLPNYRELKTEELEN